MKFAGRWKLVGFWVALISVLCIPATSAQAGRSVVHDRRGDAKAGYDLVSVVVSNGRKNLSLKVVYRGKLTPRGYPGLGLQTGLDIDFGEPDKDTYSGDFSVYSAIGALGMGNGVILLDKKAHRVSCSGLRAKTRVPAGIVRIVVPQSCFGGQAGRARIAGFTYAIRGTGRTADYITRWGRWTKLG